MSFFGREKILARLEGLWQKSNPSLVTVRGRRRIGKSTLISEFASRTADHFIDIDGQAPAKGVNNKTQLKSFVEQLAAQTNMPYVSVSSWLQAFQLLDAAIPNDGRTVVLLDEISWMGGKDKAFAGTLKIVWDKMLKRHSNLIVVLCGSVSSWIAENILHGTGFVGRDSLDLVIDELPMKECLSFWGDAKDRTTSHEIFDFLSITGGVPKYLEELNPSKTADENIRELCFTKSGLLFRDFDQIFNSVFGAKSDDRRTILEALAGGARSVSELSQCLGKTRNGHLGETLEELELAGFVAKDWGVNPQTGRAERTARYRVKDNYTRFYLHHIGPLKRQIQSGIFRFDSLADLKGWDAICGLQFENLIIQNYRALLPILGIDGATLLSAAPYRRSPGRDGTKGVQVDLLLQTQSTAYVIEIKRQASISDSVADEIKDKVSRLGFHSSTSIRTALVYDGIISPRLRTDHLLDFIIPAERLLK